MLLPLRQGHDPVEDVEERHPQGCEEDPRGDVAAGQRPAPCPVPEGGVDGVDTVVENVALFAGLKGDSRELSVDGVEDAHDIGEHEPG